MLVLLFVCLFVCLFVLKEAKESRVPPSVVDLFRTPNMAAKTLNMMFNW